LIVNSSPLIIFGKLNKVDILVKLFKEIEISDGVYKETILEGLERKFEDTLILKNYLETSKIKVIKIGKKYIELSDKIQNLHSIGIGESQTIALAKQLNRKELLLDDFLAREAARSLSLHPIGSLRVLLLAYTENLLKEKEVKDNLNKMIKLKFRISAAVLIRFWELFEKIKKK